MNVRYLSASFFSILIFTSCQNNNKENPITVVNEIIVSHNEIKKNDNPILSSDTIFKILYQEYNFPENIDEKITENPADFFDKIDFPFKYPKEFSIDYYCKKESFRLEDFYIFKKLNNVRTCEYISLIDTTNFIELIARKCDEMENWISLYVLNKDYKVIGYKQLLNVGGDSDYSPIDFKDKIVKYTTTVDTLNYLNNEYRIYTNEIFEISDSKGNNTKNIGLLILKIIKVNDKGNITWKDSLIFKSEYYDTFKTKNK
jgi:hypothetical protein